MAQVVRFGTKSEDSTHRIVNSKNGMGLWSSVNLAEEGRPGTAAGRGSRYTLKLYD